MALLHPSFIQSFTDFINEIEGVTGRTFRLVQGLRTFAEQQALYDQGRTTPGKIVTHAKGGQSWHNYGIAGDICPFALGQNTLDWHYDFHIIRNFAIKHGLECGMDWPEPLTDEDHFENRFGMTIEQAEHKYNDKDFIPGTTFINLAA